METDTKADHIRELEDKVEALQRFKSWVHAYLDTHGVPHHPPGTHGAEGCRIGDRMDWLMAELTENKDQCSRLEELVDRLNAELADLRQFTPTTAEWVEGIYRKSGRCAGSWKVLADEINKLIARPGSHGNFIAYDEHQAMLDKARATAFKEAVRVLDECWSTKRAAAMIRQLAAAEKPCGACGKVGCTEVHADEFDITHDFRPGAYGDSKILDFMDEAGLPTDDLVDAPDWEERSWTLSAGVIFASAREDGSNSYYATCWRKP